MTRCGSAHLSSQHLGSYLKKKTKRKKENKEKERREEETEGGGKEWEEGKKPQEVLDNLFVITIHLFESVFLCLIFFLSAYLLST